MAKTAWAAAALAIAPAPVIAMPAPASPATVIDAELVGYQARDNEAGVWRRYDVRFTNRADEPQTLSMCPNDALLYAPEGLNSERLSVAKGFATAFDRNNWTYNCSQTAIAPGKSVVLSLYFNFWELGSLVRPIVFDTSLGRFSVNDGTVTQVAIDELAVIEG